MKHRIVVIGFCAASATAWADGSGGDVRVDVMCAYYWATPDNGLRLAVDGVALPSIGTNLAAGIAVSRHGNE